MTEETNQENVLDIEQIALQAILNQQGSMVQEGTINSANVVDQVAEARGIDLSRVPPPPIKLDRRTKRAFMRAAKKRVKKLAKNR